MSSDEQEFWDLLADDLGLAPQTKADVAHEALRAGMLPWDFICVAVTSYVAEHKRA